MVNRSGRIIELLCVAAAVGYAAVYVVLSVQRIGHPFELEWMEGGSLAHLMRVLRGEPLFVTPSLEFVPFPYPPFYYYLAACLSKVTGANFLTLRLISLLSSLGTAVLVHRFVAREVGRTESGLICAGIFLATWRESGLYFDVGRIDSLFVFLLMLSLYWLRFYRARWQLTLAAFVAFLAVMTKQTGAVVVAPVALWCLWEDWQASGHRLSRWREWTLSSGYALPLFALIGLGTALLNGVIDDHFLLHIVNAQQSHGTRPEMIGWFFWRDLLRPLPIVCAFTLLWPVVTRLVGPVPDADVRPRWGVFYAVVLVGVLLACLIPRIKVSGAANNLIPVHAWLVVLFGIAAARLSEYAGRLRPGARLPATGVALCSLLQLGILYYDPAGFVPTEADRRAGERLLERLALVDGEVLIPSQGYLMDLVGKRAYAHQMPVSDYAKSGLAEAELLAAGYERAIREQRFELILDSNTEFLRSYPESGLLARYYRTTGWVFSDADVFVPISGAPIRPGKTWVPR